MSPANPWWCGCGPPSECPDEPCEFETMLATLDNVNGSIPSVGCQLPTKYEFVIFRAGSGWVASAWTGTGGTCIGCHDGSPFGLVDCVGGEDYIHTFSVTCLVDDGIAYWFTRMFWVREPFGPTAIDLRMQIPSGDNCPIGADYVMSLFIPTGNIIISNPELITLEIA